MSIYTCTDKCTVPMDAIDRARLSAEQLLLVERDPNNSKDVQLAARGIYNEITDVIGKMLRIYRQEHGL